MFDSDPRREALFAPAQLRSLVDRAVTVKNDNRFNLDVFVDVYGAEKIAEHLEEVEEKTRHFGKEKPTEAVLLGHIFEATVLDLAKRFRWFGEHSEVMQASKYDDLKGIDMITTMVDQQGNARHFEMASDLAFGQQRALSKFAKITSEVRDGKLANVQYFHSELLGFTGRLRDVPRTVIGMDSDNLQKLMLQWLRDPEEAQLQYAKMVLSQIDLQCMAFTQLAKATHGPGSVIRDKYYRARAAVKEVLPLYEDIEIPNDRIHNQLHKLCHNIRTQNM